MISTFLLVEEFDISEKGIEKELVTQALKDLYLTFSKGLRKKFSFFFFKNFDEEGENVFDIL